jgi:hypothetical protein
MVGRPVAASGATPVTLSSQRKRGRPREAASTSLRLYVIRLRSTGVCGAPLCLFLRRCCGRRRKLQYRRLLALT